MTEDEVNAMLASVKSIEMCLFILTGALIGALVLRNLRTERIVDAETGKDPGGGIANWCPPARRAW